MESKTLLTVNVITYNHAPYVARCLNSLLAQKTEFGFIIRIFDDCSTDGSTEICRQYAEKYPDKIQFYPAEKNLGPLLNALRSYSGITTKYYLFIESDDFRMDKFGFQKQIEALEKHSECSFCCTSTIIMKDDKFHVAYPSFPTGIYTLEDVIKKPDLPIFTNLLTRIVRTRHIKIDEKNPHRYLSDYSQLYILLEQAPFYFIKKIYGCHAMTGTGIYTDKNFLEKMSNSANFLLEFDRYSYHKYKLNHELFFIQHANTMYGLEWNSNHEKKFWVRSLLYGLLPGYAYMALRKIYHGFKSIHRKIYA